MSAAHDPATLRAQLARTPDVLEALVETLAESALDHRSEPGTWTIFEVLCHVTDAEARNWIPRARLILRDGAAARFTPFDREAGIDRYAGWPVVRLLAEFRTRRQDNLNALDAMQLDRGDLAREGHHPDLGVVTLGQLLSTWVTHDHAHLAQICRLLVTYYGAGVGPWKRFFRYLKNS